MAKSWDCEDFLLSWAARTPGKAAPSPSLLAGICVKVDSEAAAHYHYLPLDNMGADPAGRLRALFAVKHKYNEEELEPYLLDLVGGSGQPKSKPELLLAHTRLVDGFYFAKS